MTTAQQTIFFIYLVIGPLCCAGMLFLMWAGRKRMTLLSRPAPLPTPAPKVSLIIPAKDEAAAIRQCIESVVQQDYPDYEILAVNDRSADDTGKILDELATRHARLRVLHIGQQLTRTDLLVRGVEAVSGHPSTRSHPAGLAPCT